MNAITRSQNMEANYEMDKIYPGHHYGCSGSDQ